MVKKILSALILFSVAICASASAANFDPYNNKNMVKFYAHQGLESFLLKDSLRVTEKNSLKVVSFDFIIFDSIQPQNTRWDEKKFMAFAYDTTARKIYFADEKGNAVSFLNPNGTIAEGSGYAMGAEMIYNLAFGKKFYGCPTYLDANKNYILYADLGAQGAGLYIDRHTISIAAELPTGYEILVGTVEVPNAAEGSTRIANRYVHRYSFNIRKFYALRYVDEENKWIKLNPKITNPEDENFTYDAKIAEMAFYVAVGAKFFGALDNVTFDENFYKVLD